MKKINDDIDKKGLNDVIFLSRKILKIAYIFLLVGAIVLITFLCKELKILNFFLTILKICSPLFIGFIIAWVFNPLVTFLEKKGLRRWMGTTLIYLSIAIFIAVIFVLLVPTISEQFNDIIKIVPDILSKAKDFITNLFENFKNVDGVDVKSIQGNVINSFENIAVGITTNLPNKIFGILTSIFSGLGILLVSLIIGFYMLLNFSSISKFFISLFPKKYRYELNELLKSTNEQVYNFVKGTLFVSLVIFVVNSIIFAIIGLKSPLLFGLICGLTNVIPYIGPYIGAVPAALVGFSQSNLIGFLVIISIWIVQTIDGNFFTPYVVGKKLNLHPVSIMMGLLIFGYFFGIVGMLIATPCIALIKIIVTFFIKKFNLFNYSEEE